MFLWQTQSFNTSQHILESMQLKCMQKTFGGCFCTKLYKKKSHAISKTCWLFIDVCQNGWLFLFPFPLFLDSNECYKWQRVRKLYVVVKWNVNSINLSKNFYFEKGHLYKKSIHQKTFKWTEPVTSESWNHLSSCRFLCSICWFAIW